MKDPTINGKQSMEAFVNRFLAIRLSGPQRYALATLLVGTVTGVRLLLADTLMGYPYLLYFPLVILCGLVFDYGTSLYITFVSAFLAIFLFVEPRYQLALATSSDTVALVLFLVSALAVSAIIEVLRLASERLQTAHVETRQALAERDLLLRELSHRVQNDFQAISNLLQIQAIQVAHPGAKEALQAAADRVGILGRVHAHLTHRGHGTVNLGAFLRELAADFQAALIGSRLIRLELDVEEIAVSQSQAVHIGLVVNELLTNAIKYAFPNNRLGRVALTLARENDHLLLQVADDGVGAAPEGSETTGLGTGLVLSLVRLLDGTLEVEGDDGMSYTARIPIHRA